MLGLSQGHLLVSCPCQKDIPSARPYIYLYNKHPCELSSCKQILDIDNLWFSGNASPLTCFAFHFCRCAMVISTYLNFRAKGAFGVHPIVWTKMRHPAPWGPEGMDQAWVLPNLGGCRCESWNHRLFLRWWTFVVAWGFSVHHFGTLNYLSLASGWNLCRVVISCISSHHSFQSAVDLLWWMPHGCLSMWWHGEKISCNDFKVQAIDHRQQLRQFCFQCKKKQTYWRK